MAESLMTYGVPGPQGIQGPTGATGPQGPRGPRGPTGSSGSISVTYLRIQFSTHAAETYSLSAAKLFIACNRYCTLVVGRGQTASFYFDGGNGQIELNSSGSTLTVTKSGYDQHANGYAIS